MAPNSDTPSQLSDLIRSVEARITTHQHERQALVDNGNRTNAIRMFGGFASVSQQVTMRNNGSVDTSAIAVTGGHFQLNGLGAGDITIGSNPRLRCHSD